MLITNFASGELSENLFGRTDLPQYYNSAARMENFDVIPTGGIKRRSGTERLLNGGGLTNVSGDGRIIPFIVDRKHAFVLYLSPGKLMVYKVYDGRIYDQVLYNSSNELRLYESVDEIRDVQYAQDYDTMILCHENYPPLELKLNIKGDVYNLTISKLALSFEKKVIQGKGVTAGEAFIYKIKDDEVYSDNGWLTTDKNYPAAVSFFNGRLVFAGTKNKRQRVFASAVKETGKPYNFSTGKIFLTEKKEYIVIKGSVDGDNKKVIIIQDEEGLKFSSALENYFIDSPFYDSDTRIFRLQEDKLEMTKEPRIETISPSALDDLEEMIKKADEWDLLPSGNEIEVASFAVEYKSVTPPFSDIYDTKHVYVTPGATKFKIRVYHEKTGGIFHSKEDEFNFAKGVNTTTSGFNGLKFLDISDAVKKYEEDNSFYRDLIYKAVNTEVGEANKDKINTAAMANVSKTLTDNSVATMKYQLTPSITYYNFPWEMKIIVEGRMEVFNNIYIPFYTREILSDEYPTPDCGFTFEIASDMNDSIRWLAVNKGLIIGTETAEWIVPPGVHATSIQASLNSRFGSDKIQGTAMGDATVFFQAGKKSLVEYYIPQADNNFRANNMAMLSPQMLSESPAVEFDFVSAPHTKLFVTREDGTAATLLYERGTGTFAWSRMTTAGMIRSIAVLPGTDGNDDVYLLVQRAGGWFLERLRENGSVYVDGYSQGSQSGYPYRSVLRTMPVLANDKMKKQRIVSLVFRFLGSFISKMQMKSLAGGREIHTGLLTNIRPPVEGVQTGIHRQTFSGTWDEEVQVELVTDETAPVKILALNAEMAAGG